MILMSLEYIQLQAKLSSLADHRATLRKPARNLLRVNQPSKFTTADSADVEQQHGANKSNRQKACMGLAQNVVAPSRIGLQEEPQWLKFRWN